MNYLSHFHLDREKCTPNFTLGLMLPDLARNHPEENIRFRLPHLTKGNAEIKAGILRHLEVDELFHESPFFEKMMTAIKAKILAADFENVQKRIYALAHVWLEIMMDRALLHRDNSVGDEYYNQLTKVNEPDFVGFLIVNGLSKKPEKFWQRFCDFRERQYLRNYLNDDSLAWVFERIARQVGNPSLSTPDKNKLQSLFHDIDGLLAADNLSIFTTL